MAIVKGQITLYVAEKGEIGEDVSGGKMLYRDPEFRKGINDCSIYNNLQNGTVTVTRIVRPIDCPTTSTHCLEIKTIGLANPIHGGYTQAIQSRPNAVFIQKIIAKIPIGYNLRAAASSLGIGSEDEIITDAKGTGNYKTYLRRSTCGTTGTFSSGGSLYLSGGETTTIETPLIWYVASSTVYDMSDSEKYDDAINSAQAVADALTEKAENEGWSTKLTYIDSQGIFTGKLSANTVDAIHINASQITAGTIDTARLNVADLKATLITASNINALTLNSIKGTIGGWTINSGSISSGNIVLDKTNNCIAVYGMSSSSISGQRVQLYHNSNSDFGLFATDNAGAMVFHLGSSNSIAGWVITSNRIYKNSISLGADGSITNGVKWQMNNDGSGILANGNIVWDSSGDVTFSSTVSLNWTTPIGNITTALGGNSFPKLTKITSTGIYTGTLTASQINAVSISASSIKTGTLSADRIAAGSISATKLDADSIKTNIINTSYINGLSCTFSQGTIGGWQIQRDNITSGTIGGGGVIGIQLRTESSGAGYWYFGAYKPCGISMTWHMSNNAGHIVLGEIADSGDSVKTGFMGLQMMSWDGLEYFCLSANYIRSGAKEVYNRIAGWAFDSERIWKNSVSLGADGSISNSRKWQLNNDGSGQIASGNISWSSGGIVTFSSAVSLQWKNDIEAAKTTNFGYSYYKSIVIYGESDKYYPVVFKGGDQTIKRDILVRRSFSEQAPSDWHNSTHMGGLILLLKTNFGGWGGASYSWDIYELSEIYSRMFAGASILGNSCMFGVFLRGGGSTGAIYHLYSDQPIESSLYSPPPIPMAPQIAYNSDLIFNSGSYRENAPPPRTLTADVENEIRRRRFIALAQNSDTTLTEHPLTYIGSTGIYTGTLTAHQINAVAISASSIITGTLSADRIAAGSISATKLDADSIKTNIINTSYINGLSCTFSKGTIGGWAISSTSIHKNSVSLSADGSIVNSSKWQLNNDGSGRLANGNIAWNASGDVTFGSSVSLNWTSAVNDAQELASAMAYGKMLYRDPTFYNGENSVSVYNNSGNGTVTISRIQNNNAPNDSKYVLHISNTGSSSPQCGGFSFQTTCSYRKIFITRIIAKIPSGRSILFATNSIGADGSSKWLTSNVGTGDWCEYIYKVVCGTSSFSSTNFFYLSGAFGVTWDVAYATVFDVTSVEKSTTTIDSNGIYTGTLNASQITAGTISAAHIDTNSLKTVLITATNINALTLTTSKGQIGGWNINSTQISKNSVILGADGSIQNGSLWQLNNDGSGRLANGNISWNASGAVSFGSSVSIGLPQLNSTIIQDGKIKTSLLNAVDIVTTALSAQIITTNRLNVISGASIGGFKIEGDSIRSKGSGLSLSPNGISFSSSGIYAGFGLSSGPGVLGVDIPVWINNSRSDLTCIGMAVSASGALNKFNNIAINIMGGCISGFAVKVRQISSSTYLSNSDCWVGCYNSGPIVVYLPTNPPVGKIIYVKLMNNKPVDVNGQGKQLFAERAYSQLNIPHHGSVAFFVWDGQYWSFSRIRW